MTSTECPVSVVVRNPQIDVLVGEIAAATSIKEATGAVMFGTDSAKWNCRWFDAVTIFTREENAVEAAYRKAPAR